MKKFFSITFLLLISLLALTGCKKTTITTDEATTMSDTGTIETIDYSDSFIGVDVDSTVSVDETFYMSLNEKTVGFIKENLNPYKSSEITVDAVFTSPSGKTYTRPGYFYQEYELSLLSGTYTGGDNIVFDDELEGTDTAKKVGDPYFRISFRPKEEGTYSYLVNITINGVSTQSFSGSITSLSSNTESTYKGKITIDETNNLYFKYENGGTFIPIGMNNAWYTSSYRKSYDYDVWFKYMSEAGMNYTRIWLASWSFALHMGSSVAEVDNFDSRQNQLARLDRVLSIAEEDGIYVCLCLLNHGQFSSITDAEWSSNPYSKIIDYPFQFFTNETCKAIYKDELRYIIARYGDFDSIMDYELFNEVDWIDGYTGSKYKVRDWHEEMAEYISSIDAYDRLITTSYKDATGLAYKLDSIDFVSIHDYSFKSASGIIVDVKEAMQNYIVTFNKPVMYEEWGIDSTSGKATYDSDPEGISLYQALYGSILGGSCATAMDWWWDTYIHQYNLYHIYEGVSALSKQMDLSGSLIYLSSNDLTVSDSTLSFIGIKNSKNSVYGYLYNSSYTRTSSDDEAYNDINVSLSLPNGEYIVTIQNAMTGDVIETKDITSLSGIISFNLSFTNDVVIIINNK